MYRFLIAALAICLAFPALAADETATKAEKTRRIIELSMTPETLTDMGARTGRLIAADLDRRLKAQGKSLSDEARATLIVRMTEGFLDLIAEAEDDMVQVYSEELTERELDLLLEVYADPEMAAVMTKMPAIMERLMPVIQQRTPPMVQRVFQEMQREGLLNDL